MKKGFINKLKGVLASAAAVVMTVGMIGGNAIPAMADTTGSTVTKATFTYEGTGATTDGQINLNNASKNATYQLYKIFDATYSGSNVAYTVKSGDLKTKLETDGTDYFTIASTADSNGNYSVTRTMKTEEGETDKPKKTDAELLEYLENIPVTDFVNIGGITAPADGKITWDKIPYGYYIIKSTKDGESQAAVTIDSNTPSRDVIDKNQSTIVPDKQESVNGGTDWSYQGATTDPDTLPSAQVGDTVNYKVVGSFTQYAGTTPVTKLTFTDTMSKGLTANQDVTVKINGTALESTAFTVEYNTDSTTGQTTTTIEIPTATVTEGKVTAFTYNANNTYEITYSAKLNDKAVTSEPEINTVKLQYSDDQNKTYDVGTDTTKVKDYNLTINKVDENSNALKGAKFELYRNNDADAMNLVPMTDAELTVIGVTTKDDDTVYYRVAVDGDSSASKTTTIDMTNATHAVIYGLDGADTYKTKEIQAPNGYNILTSTVDTEMDNSNQTATIQNKQGSFLPSTGGIGTTIFYVIGGVVIAGAVILLIARRRKNA